MFFDVKFYSHANPGKALIAHFPCVATCQLDEVFHLVNSVDYFDVVIASIVTEREIIFSSDESIEVITEKLP